MLKTFYVVVMPNITADEILSLGSDLLNFHEHLWEAEKEKLQYKAKDIVEITVVSMKDKPCNKDIH